MSFNSQISKLNVYYQIIYIFILLFFFKSLLNINTFAENRQVDPKHNTVYNTLRRNNSMNKKLQITNSKPILLGKNKQEKLLIRKYKVWLYICFGSMNILCGV